MRVKNLSDQSTEYTSNVYHVIGDYLQLSDLNTLIDVGRDESVLGQLRTIKTGLGKKAVDQIYLTHSHFDHAALLGEILSRYPVPVYAHPESRIPGIIPILDGQIIYIADRKCEAVWAEAHSEDSICYYSPDDGLLFSGDIPIRIYTNDGIYNPEFLPVFEKICSFELTAIYPGHGEPIGGNVRHLLDESLYNLKRSKFA